MKPKTVIKCYIIILEVICNILFKKMVVVLELAFYKYTNRWRAGSIIFGLRADSVVRTVFTRGQDGGT